MYRGFGLAMIHPTAHVSAEADIAEDVAIGPFSVVYGNVEIGGGTRIGSHCSIGEPPTLEADGPLIVGANSLIRSHTVLYAGSRLGPHLETGHHVTIREGLTAGINLRVGTHADLQGNTTIGDYVRLHSAVQIHQGSKLHDFVWIFPSTVLTNDPHPPSDGCLVGIVVEEYAAIAAACCIAPGITIGARSLVGASSLVTHDVEPDTLVRGHPARLVGPAADVLLRDGSGRPAYPWTTHFRRGYPPDVVAEWSKS